MSRSIWFVRHAQSEYNQKKLFTGWHDPNLTEHCKEKAHQLKKDLGMNAYFQSQDKTLKLLIN